MKKLLFCLLVLGGIALKAQDASKVYSASEIVWFGLDFTKAKFVGQFDQGMGAMPATGGEMRNKWIPQWNALIQNEQQNFDLRKALDKESIYYDIASVNTLNSKINPDACMDFNPTKIEKSQISEMVKAYSSNEKKEGVGLSFIVENFNKGTQMASVYVTFFDIATKKVLVCGFMEGKVAGVGIRNYWAGAIKSIIKQLGNGTFKSWKD
jgi:hypothetical protein